MHERKRNHQLSMRLTEDEYATWERKQLASGLNKTEFLMKLTDSCSVNIFCYDEAMKPVITELRRIGNNLNHIARVSNSSDAPAGAYIKNTLASMLSDYNDVMALVRKTIRDKDYIVKRVE